MATFQKLNGMFDEEMQRPQDQLLNPQGQQQSGLPGTPQINSGASTSINAGAASNKALQGQSAAQYTQSQAPNAAAALVAKNTGKQANVDLSSGVTKATNEGQQKAQAEANAYATQNQNNYQGDMQADARNAATNDDSFGRLSKLVNTEGQRVKDFQYSGPTQFDDVKNLTSTAGISNGLAQQNQGTGYTKGQSRLDALLLKNDKKFQNQAQNTQQSLQSLRDVVGTQSEKLNGAGGVLDKQFNDFQNLQGTAKDLVGRQATSIKENANQRNSALNSQNASVRDRYKNIQNEMVEDIKKRSGGFENSNPFLQDNLKKLEGVVGGVGGLNNGVDANGFISEQDAGQYNRLQSLINGSDRLTAEGQAGSAASFDEEGYRKRLREALLGITPMIPKSTNVQPNAIPNENLTKIITNGNGGAVGPIPGMPKPMKTKRDILGRLQDSIKETIKNAPVSKVVQAPVTALKKAEQKSKLPPSITPIVPQTKAPAPSTVVDKVLNRLDPTNKKNWRW